MTPSILLSPSLILNGTRVKIWLKSVSNYSILTGIENIEDSYKTALLLYTIEKEAQRRLYRDSLLPNSFQEAVEHFRKCFAPAKTLISLRYEFRNIIQKENETIQKFMSTLKNLVTDCRFGSLENEMLIDQFLNGINNRRIREKLLVQE